MRDKLIKLLFGTALHWSYEYSDEDFLKDAERTADYLIASGVTVQEWIPVSERLPEDSGYYLVHHKDGFVSERYFYEDAPEIFAQVRNCPVTHWMPLPAAPKEVE
jgi:hypothetical protein